jgi:23S rRNA (pseudouridine1915-N3)-methyltransferase
MLTIKIIVVDSTRSSFLRKGEAFYLERIKKYARTQWVEVKPAKIKKSTPAEAILSAEGASITKKIQPRDYAIALDRSGQAYNSKKLAGRIERLSQNNSRLAFIIGGPLGLSKTILEKANEVLSLSRLTLTHEMSRLILLEQIYRSFTIINNEKYHK